MNTEMLIDKSKQAKQSGKEKCPVEKRLEALYDKNNQERKTNNYGNKK